mmetsp:Transcript_5720/g.17475  ORF Transcript_5720/g.17475 Transcript_5720/m.17475 type:complete len:210 (-) Transcript_5720:161-790(-)
MVPAGTGMTKSSALAPCIEEPSPLVPFGARQCTRRRKPVRLLHDTSTSAQTLPPRPPLPPAGPPNSTNFSRRIATQPCPPSPDLMQIFAVSKHRISTGSRLWVPLPPSSSSSSSKPSKGRIWALVERIPGSKAFSSASMSSAPEVPCLNDFRFFLPASPASRPALPVHVGAESASAAACLRCVRLPVPLGDVSAPGAAACTRDACRQPR